VDMAAIQQQLVAVQGIVRSYAPSDVYNCDETGLFCKRLPEKDLSTQSIPGQKQSKARITLHFCCNATGSDKPPIWFIGKSVRPRAFGTAQVHLSALDCVWKRFGE